MYTVVIADDENIECISIKLFLTSEFPDIQVLAVAANGIELIKAVTELRPDIALVDVNMPGMTGLEAIEILRLKENMNTRFVILTAYDEFEYVKKALSLKVNDYVLKPIKREVLVQTLKETCRHIDESRITLEEKRQKDDMFIRMDDVLEKEIIYSILMGEPDMADFNIFCELNRCTFHRGIFITMCPDKKWKMEEKNREQIRRLIKQTLSNAAVYLFSMNDSNFYTVIFVPEHLEQQEIQSWIENLVAIMLNELLSKCGLVCRVGISSIWEDFQDMFIAYQESRTSLEVLAGQDIVFYSQIQSVTEDEDVIDLKKNHLSEEKITNAYVLEAVHIMKENYHQDISLDDIAGKIGISSYYLSRIFKQELGTKLTEYLTGLRMERAIILARTTDLTISEIGKAVGYYNPTYFCRIFKKSTGKTIGQLRQKARDDK